MEEPANKRAKLQSSPTEDWQSSLENLKILQNNLAKGCLCHVRTLDLQRPNVSVVKTGRIPINSPHRTARDYALQFISSINFLSEVALKQQTRGFICNKIMDMASGIAMDERIWEMLLDYIGSNDKFIAFASSKCVVTMLMWTKLPNLNEIFDDLFQSVMVTTNNPLKLSYILNIVRGVVEYKYESEHPLDDVSDPGSNPHSPSSIDVNLLNLNENLHGANTSKLVCAKVEVETEIETEVKTHCVKALETWWTRLLSKFQNMMAHYNVVNESAVETFLSLWHSIISVKNNLSVIDTKHYYMHLEAFVPLLNPNSPAIVWKKLTDVFNEILCYGSTLSLQDVPNEEPCDLAHLIIRCVRSRQFLQSVPYSRTYSGFGGSSSGPVDWEWENDTLRGDISHFQAGTSIGRDFSKEALRPSEVLSKSRQNSKPESKLVITNTIYIGPSRDAIQLETSEEIDGDTPLLQKVVLLVLKSVAVTVQETKADDSDSGDEDSRSESHSGSDSDTNDMIFVEKSIRDVFRELDLYVKSVQPFHPNTPLGEWIVKLFIDQDDALVEAMLCVLDTYRGFLGKVNFPEEFRSTFHPVRTFVTFLNSISNDKDVLLDWLMGNETCFLLYLLTFLKFSFKNWQEFVLTCGRELESTMSVLIRLRIGVGRLVERSLFPYNINPVLRLLEKCEGLYEKPEVNP